MSEQETPRTVEDAAREAAERRHPEGGQEWVSGVGREEFAAGFIAGATWQAARTPSVEQVAEAVQRLIDRAVEVAADDTPLLVAVQDARAAVVALWGAATGEASDG